MRSAHNRYRDSRRTWGDDSEDLAHGPSGGPVKQWLAGIAFPLVPIIYGIHCLQRGYTTMFGNRGGSEELTGNPGIALAIAYIAIGAFFHFHFFWGLSDRLWTFSQALKLVSLMVFLPAIGYALYSMVSFF